MGIFKKIICVVLAGVVIFTTPAFAYSETESLERTLPEQTVEVTVPEPQGTVITSFAPLSSTISSQSMVVHGRASALIFPETLQAVKRGGEAVTISDVRWIPDKPFSTGQTDVFTYTPELPGEYRLAEGTTLPRITVHVNRRITYATGIITSYNRSAAGSISNTITVYPSDGRKVYLQFYTGGRWVTKATYTTADEYRSTITINYPKEWYENPTSTWRIYIPESPQGIEFSQKVTMNIARRYQPPAGYRQIQDAIPTRTSSYCLSVGMSGLKVDVVNKRLGIGGKAYYSTVTKNAVIAFQKRYGLPATGVVDYTTWKKMGYSWNNWCYLDSYVTPNRVPRNATKSNYVDAMIATAEKYLGDPYVWCASGRVSHGVDCTGLVFQVLYSVGIDPLPLGSHVYAYNSNQYSARKLAALPGFYRPTFASRQRGDLIFYGSPVFHVAVYVGGDRIIEASPGYGVRTNSVYAYPIHSVIRPIV